MSQPYSVQTYQASRVITTANAGQTLGLETYTGRWQNYLSANLGWLASFTADVNDVGGGGWTAGVVEVVPQRFDLGAGTWLDLMTGAPGTPFGPVQFTPPTEPQDFARQFARGLFQVPRTAFCRIAVRVPVGFVATGLNVNGIAAFGVYDSRAS